jgi:double-stranded uracil-DNA glycosylase
MNMIANKPWKPTAEQLAAAHGGLVPDLIGPDLRVLFCGINPGLYSAAIGHHFGRPGNRFWPALHAGGFTPRLFTPFEERDLLLLGYGITNIAARGTARADELTDDELRQGAMLLERKVRRYRPRMVAFLGVTSYRTGFHRPLAKIGLQEERLADAGIWVLPSPSGLNAHHQPAELARLFQELRDATN